MLVEVFLFFLKKNLKLLNLFFNNSGYADKNVFLKFVHVHFSHTSCQKVFTSSPSTHTAKEQWNSLGVTYCK